MKTNAFKTRRTARENGYTVRNCRDDRFWIAVDTNDILTLVSQGKVLGSNKISITETDTKFHTMDVNGKPWSFIKFMGDDKRFFDPTQANKFNWWHNVKESPVYIQKRAEYKKEYRNGK